MKNKSFIRVCMVSPLPPPFGGISIWTSLIHEYVAYQDNVKIIQVNTANRWRRIDDFSIWKRIFYGGVQLLQNLFSLLLALLKNIDVIHLTTSGGMGVIRDIVILVIGKVFRIPVIYHIRFGRISEIASEKNFEWFLFSISLKLAKVIIAIDQKTKNMILANLPGINVKYVPNPIDLSDLTVSDSDEVSTLYVLFLGWVIPTKGVEELINAWSELDQQNWSLLIAGPGDYKYRQKLILKYSPKNIKFLDELSHEHAMHLMSQSGIFILPSYTEGFPNVILEAMAFGKPIIATSVGAIPEMLSGECGLIIEPQNTNEIKHALTILMKDGKLRSSLGENAHKRVMQKYSMKKVFSEYLDIWQRASE